MQEDDHHGNVAATAAATVTAEDLLQCDREPIHRLGTIQPFGFLVAVTADLMIAIVSDNVERFAGRPASALLGLPLNELFPRPAVHDIRNRLLQVHGTTDAERMFGLDLLGTGDTRFDCAVHYSGEYAIIEAEPSRPVATSEVAGLIRSMNRRLDRAEDLERFVREGARQMRLLTGFDRVMVYRFHEDASGQVAAEIVARGVEPLHGLNFPASDIPRQARALYLRNPFRMICDVEEEPVSLVSNPPDAGRCLDLSSSVLRAVSPIHVRYLRNMGVTASLSVSIIVHGRLWGLFACHHFSARSLPFDQRTLIELFGEMFSLRLDNREQLIAEARQAAARAAGDRLVAAVAGDTDLLSKPDRLMTLIDDVLPCDAIVIHRKGRSTGSGTTPPPELAQAVAAHLRNTAPGVVFATDRLSAVLPDVRVGDGSPAGVLAIPMSAQADDYIMFFRQERTRAVTWAGDPNKAVDQDEGELGLTPRASFSAWCEEVRGRSEPFTRGERATAETLRLSMEVVLQLATAR